MLGPWSAGWAVVATMVGAGIFSSVGSLCGVLDDVPSMFIVWTLGGVLALAGALCFAELGTLFPRGGGEYAYARQILGPTAGFLTGYISFSAGFAAALGYVALRLGESVSALVSGIDPRLVATLVVGSACAVHGYGVRHGAGFNNAAAILKIGLLATFIVGGFLATPELAALDETVATSDANAFSAALATALVMVTFSYTGWNAAGYIGGEIKNPSRNIPRALVGGTIAVTVLYLLVNAIYFRMATPGELAGRAETGHIIAKKIFGDGVGDILGWAIVLVLISTISAFVMTGPRILVAMAEDGLVPARLGRHNERGAPTLAVILLGVFTLPFLWIEALDETLHYIGVTLNVATTLAIVSVIVARRKFPDAERPFRAPLHPLPAIAYLLLATWMTVVSVRDNPWSALASIITLALGLVLYRVLGRR